MELENRPASSGPQHGASTAGGLPGSIDGLELPELRERLGCDDAVIETILRLFLSEYGGWHGDFAAACAAQDMATMTRMAHTLKGSALNIAAPRLQAAALALETALREGRGAQPALVQECSQALQELLQALRISLPVPQAPAAGTATEQEQQEVIVRLRELLRLRRIVSPALQQQVRAALSPLDTNGRLATLLDQLAQFEYRKAQQTLAEIEQDMK